MDLLTVDMEAARFSGKYTLTRREMNLKMCLSVTVSIMFNVIAGFLVALYVVGAQQRVSPAEVSQGTFYERQQEDRPTEVTAIKHRPYARLTVSNETTGKIIYWDRIHGEKPTMKYDRSEGSLLIPEDGYYIINLQITYRKLTENAMSSYSELLMHQVMKRSESYNKPSPILTVSEIVPHNEVYWTKTTHSTARISLRKGDKLHVELYNASTYKLVDRGGTPWTKTFWGVYLDIN